MVKPLFWGKIEPLNFPITYVGMFYLFQKGCEKIILALLTFSKFRQIGIVDQLHWFHGFFTFITMTFTTSATGADHLATFWTNINVTLRLGKFRT